MINEMMKNKSIYKCWLNYKKCKNIELVEEYSKVCINVAANNNDILVNTALEELRTAVDKILGIKVMISETVRDSNCIQLIVSERVLSKDENTAYNKQVGSFSIEYNRNKQLLKVVANDGNGILYGVFEIIKAMRLEKKFEELAQINIPCNELRMINHWDNISGDIERGYAGQSFFFRNNTIEYDKDRIYDYARLLGSIGINGIAINNVNVHKLETKFITEEYLPEVAKLADIFRAYGIKLYLSVNFAAPIEISGLATADPLDDSVKLWWSRCVDNIYKYIPDFGGFVVKADSENRPGPFTYGRNHADGANVLAKALKAHGGLVIWRCFVYNCHLDWRDRSNDRAMAAYENFKQLDGQFMDNVILQVKNGPMDFQIREAVSPLFGAMEKTNMILEFQAAQEYTGQQKHVCYLMPMWKEVLDFDTYSNGEASFVSKVVSGSLYKNLHGGIAAVSNLGDSECWTGHPLAQANMFGLGRIAWNTSLSSEEIANEWTKLTYGDELKVVDTIVSILMKSREVYEDYTSPLGIGWMVYPHHHYGPSVDGYEYTPWGTYHYADWKGIGVDRTVATGTGYTAQYNSPNNDMYENIVTCPEELLLFFHHVDYTYMLKSGKTLIQHVYDTHFEGVEQVEEFIDKWQQLIDIIDKETFEKVKDRLDIQLHDAIEWRDVINTYFYRRTGICDNKGRKIYA